MKIADLHTLLAQWEHPDKEFRSAPFWGWNAFLDRENLEFQIGEMKKEGMGGFFAVSYTHLDVYKRQPSYRSGTRRTHRASGAGCRSRGVHRGR